MVAGKGVYLFELSWSWLDGFCSLSFFIDRLASSGSCARVQKRFSTISVEWLTKTNVDDWTIHLTYKCLRFSNLSDTANTTLCSCFHYISIDHWWNLNHALLLFYFFLLFEQTRFLKLSCCFLFAHTYRCRPVLYQIMGLIDWVLVSSIKLLVLLCI